MEYPYFPVFIDLSKKKIVVVGAGRIAARRIRTLVDFAPDITVIAPEISRELRESVPEDRLCILKKAFAAEDLDGAGLVLAATDDPDLNAGICMLCRERHIPVNNAGNQADCDFFFPGIARKENVVIGVTASGLDHRQARKVTETIREVLRKGEDNGTQTCEND